MLLRKAKGLDYWKKKLIEVLNKAPMEKSLKDILFGDVLMKSLPEKTQSLLIKARGYAPGTIREWGGKKYKKLSSGKWMRTYTGTGERGEQQAIRNVMKKIQNAKDMKELSSIVSANMQRFKGEDGKTLPIVAEFMKEARGTRVGAKQEKIPKSPDGKYQIKKVGDKYAVPGRQSPTIYGANSEVFNTLQEAEEQAKTNRKKDKLKAGVLKVASETKKPDKKTSEKKRGAKNEKQAMWLRGLTERLQLGDKIEEHPVYRFENDISFIKITKKELKEAKDRLKYSKDQTMRGDMLDALRVAETLSNLTRKKQTKEVKEEIINLQERSLNAIARYKVAKEAGLSMNDKYSKLVDNKLKKSQKIVIRR